MCNCKSCQITGEIVAVAIIRWFENQLNSWEGPVDAVWSEIKPYLLSEPTKFDPLTYLEMAVSLKSLTFAAAGITGYLSFPERRLRLVREPRQRLKDVNFSFVLDSATAVLRAKEGGRSHETT